MKLQIRYISRTCLNEEVYRKFVKKYSRGIRQKILISFDLKIKNYGQHDYNEKKKTHIIKISPQTCGFSSDLQKLDDIAELYNLLASTLHELHHAKQLENLGKEKFLDDSFSSTPEVKNEQISDFYSLCEVETRIYENKMILKAVKYYNKLLIESSCK